ncbi:hypothetical protein [Bacillus sp. MRMR6]|uniref:hypothetical protein n=1 Tax=Bacillus sp. MRMR6 TaxID=1928617 RepID=UPI00158E645C|nr:hypothetical protein [Bacillus sp. MRMR6]
MEKEKFLIPEEIHLTADDHTNNSNDMTNTGENESQPESLLLTGGGDPNLSPDAGKPMI